jgi:hypothetical protein
LQPIFTAEALLGRQQQDIKEQVNNAMTKISWNERNKLRKKLKKG